MPRTVFVNPVLIEVLRIRPCFNYYFFWHFAFGISLGDHQSDKAYHLCWAVIVVKWRCVFTPWLGLFTLYTRLNSFRLFVRRLTSTPLKNSAHTSEPSRIHIIWGLWPTSQHEPATPWSANRLIPWDINLLIRQLQRRDQPRMRILSNPNPHTSWHQPFLLPYSPRQLMGRNMIAMIAI